MIELNKYLVQIFHFENDSKTFYFTGHTTNGGCGSTIYIENAKLFNTILAAEQCVRSCINEKYNRYLIFETRITYELKTV